MRAIDRIVVHCSATKVTQNFTAEQVKASHIARGFRTWGYHFYIRKDGTVCPMRPVDQMGAHAEGYNASSIGVCYEGGLDANGKAADTRTPEQKEALLKLLKELIAKYPVKHLDGHRDLSPDLDGDGIVEPSEWVKMCPCMNVHDVYKDLIK